MYSIAIRLKTDKADRLGLCPVIIDITHSRKHLRKSIGVKARPEHFDPTGRNFTYITKTDPSHLAKNQIIRRELERIEVAISRLQADGQLSADTIRAVLGGQHIAGQTLYHYAARYNETISNHGTLRRYTFYANTFIRQHYPSIAVVDVTPRRLTEMEQRLNTMYKGSNSVWGTMKYIRTVVNYAIQSGVDMAYPFGTKRGEYKMPSYRQPKRNYMTPDEVDRVLCAAAQSPDRSTMVAGLWFNLAVHSGLRYSDLARFGPHMVREDRLYFSDVKTENTHYIPLYDALRSAIAAVRDVAVLPYEAYKRKLAVLGEVAGLSFTLTSHVARHTFAVQYLNRGGSMEVLSRLLGHTTTRTTAIYGKITDRRVTDEVGRVLG